MGRQDAPEERIVGAMKRLGFTQSDARIYLALLKHHPATGYELASRSGVPRSAIYGVLRRLQASGLCNAVQHKPTRYLPLAPERLLSLIESRVGENLGELRTALDELSQRVPDNRTWTLAGYTTMLDEARRLIAGSERSVHLSVWRREAVALGAALREARSAGREIVLFSFTRLPDDLGRVLSYGIAEAEFERHWPHRIILVADRRRVLLGGAQDSADNQALVSEDAALVEMAVSNLVLDITLFGQRCGTDTAGVVAGLTSYLAPVEELMARADPQGVE